LFGAWPTNTLFAMSEIGAQMQHVEKTPVGLNLAGRAVFVLLAALVIAYFIGAFAMEEVKALWPRRRMSHTE
jgi:hypothetical protein